MQITGYSRDEMLGMNNRRIVDDLNKKKSSTPSTRSI